MRYFDTMRYLMAQVLFSTMLMGCSGPQEIAVNHRQSVVMDPSVLTAGIWADNPSVNEESGRLVARTLLSNTLSTPVTVRYRFYWYDGQGLDILPFEAPRTVTLAADSDAKIESFNSHPDAKRVRLYIFL